MKLLTHLLACLFVISCASSKSDPQTAVQDKLRNKIKVMSAKPHGAESTNAQDQSVRLLIHPENTPPNVFRATLMIDPNNNNGNYTINDVTAVIVALADSSGFAKADCPLKQIACYLKDGTHLSLESTDSPEKIRLEIIKDKTTLERTADAAVKMFFEGLTLHLQQPSKF